MCELLAKTIGRHFGPCDSFCLGLLCGACVHCTPKEAQVEELCHTTTIPPPISSEPLEGCCLVLLVDDGKTVINATAGTHHSHPCPPYTLQFEELGSTECVALLDEKNSTFQCLGRQLDNVMYSMWLTNPVGATTPAKINLIGDGALCSQAIIPALDIKTSPTEFYGPLPCMDRTTFSLNVDLGNPFTALLGGTRPRIIAVLCESSATPEDCCLAGFHEDNVPFTLESGGLGSLSFSPFDSCSLPTDPMVDVLPCASGTLSSMDLSLTITTESTLPGILNLEFNNTPAQTLQIIYDNGIQTQIVPIVIGGSSPIPAPPYTQINLTNIGTAAVEIQSLNIFGICEA